MACARCMRLLSECQCRSEVDVLRAENERLREALHTARLNGPCNCTNCPALAGERDAAKAEAAELRASLADAVGKIAAMEPVVEAAREWRDSDSTERIATAASWLWAAVDAYEASLPGIVKVGP